MKNMEKRDIKIMVLTSFLVVVFLGGGWWANWRFNRPNSEIISELPKEARVYEEVMVYEKITITPISDSYPRTTKRGFDRLFVYDKINDQNKVDVVLGYNHVKKYTMRIINAKKCEWYYNYIYIYPAEFASQVKFLVNGREDIMVEYINGKWKGEFRTFAKIYFKSFFMDGGVEVLTLTSFSPYKMKFSFWPITEIGM